MIQLDAGTKPVSTKTKVAGHRHRAPVVIPRRTAPFNQEPGFYEPAGLWFYGNIRLLGANLGFVRRTLGSLDSSPRELDEVEREAETLVLQSRVLVCGIHNIPQMRAAIVPLRWGSPRIVVFSGGFQHHLGEQLDQEPFLSATLWRDRWDHRTDLAVSLRGPEKLPTFARHNPTVDKLIVRIAEKRDLGILA